MTPFNNYLRERGGNYLEKPRLSPEELARYHAMSGMGGGESVGTRQAPAESPTPDMTQTASTGSSGPSLGGALGQLVGGLFNPQGAKEARAKQLLMEDGLDPGTATLLAGNKQALNQYLFKRSFPEQAKRDTVVVDGKLVDAQTGQVIGDYSSPEPGYRTMTEDERKAAGLPDGKYQVSPNGQVSPISGTQPKGEGMVVYGPDGNPILTTGGAKPMTESQAKSSNFLTRMEGASGTIDQYESDMITLRAGGSNLLPDALGNFVRSEKQQLGVQAGREWLTAILRGDSGGAVTPEEEQTYGRTYLPQPGDGDAVIQQKREARKRAEAAVSKGVPGKQALDSGTTAAVPSEPSQTAPAGPKDTITDDDIDATAEKYGMTRQQVIRRLKEQGRL